MAVVPVVQRRVTSQGAQGGYQTPTQPGRAAAQVAQAAGGLADVYAKLQEERDQDKAFQADAKVTEDYLGWNTKALEGAVESKAAGYADQVKAWWDDRAATLGEDLTPRQKELVSRNLQRRRMAALGAAVEHERTQLKASRVKSFDAAQQASIQSAVTIGTPEAAAGAEAELRERRMTFAATSGWTPEEIKAHELAQSSALHTAIVKKMMVRDPAGASAYYEQVKGKIAADAQPALEAAMKTSDAAVAALGAADSIWSEMGPRQDGQAVEIDKMEQAARERFKDDPVKMKATVDELRARSAAFNAAERERTAQNTNAAMAVYMQTGSIAQMERSPGYLALPAGERNTLKQHLIGQQRSAWSFGQTVKNAAEADQERAAMGSYLDYSAPEKLAAMSDAEVQALLPKLGPRLTNQLVEKRRALGNKEAAMEVTLDQQLFNELASEAGLSPYDNNKSENDKARLGSLQYRFETIIANEQLLRGKKLNRVEKEQLLRLEMGRTVQKNSWWGGTSDPVPAISINPDDVGRLHVPKDVRKEIVDALTRRGVPTTDANINRYYLIWRSPNAGALVPNAK